MAKTWDEQLSGLSVKLAELSKKAADASVDAKTYRELGADKIIAQSGRIGSRMMHYSRVAGFVSEVVSGDDRQSSNGGMEAMKHMEVMKVLGEACRRRGMKFLADIGVNSPYVNSPLESPWMRKHMDCLYEPCKFFKWFVSFYQ